MRRALGLWMLLAAALVAGCRTHTATQLLVVIGTNIPVGSSLETIEIEIRDGDGLRLLSQRSIGVSATPMPPLTVAMPFSFGVAPAGGDATRRVRVIARGRFRETRLRDRVVLTAITGFIADEKLLLPMLLDQRCVDVTNCADGLTCIGGSCQPATVDPRTLVKVEPGSTVVPSAVFDASSGDVVAVDGPAVDGPGAEVASDGGVDAPTPRDVPGDDGGDLPTMDGSAVDVPAMDLPTSEVPLFDVGPDLAPVDRGMPVDAPPAVIALQAPLTATDMMTGRPALRWRVRTVAGQTVTVWFCRERNCAVPTRTETVLTAPMGDDWALVAGSPSGIDPGRWWWSVHVEGGGMPPVVSASWWFRVPPGRGGIMVPSAPWRAVADTDGDGDPGVVVGAPLILGAPGPGQEAEVVGYDRRPSGRPAFLLRSPFGGPAPRYGSEIAVAGDIDGDGMVDLAVAETGQGVHVYRGPPPVDPRGNAGLITLRDDTVMEFGAVVAGVGDVERDGFADLAVSATTFGGGAGVVFLYRGAPGGLSPAMRTLLPSPRPGSLGYGKSVAGAGDVNGDGFGDVAISDPDANTVYVYLGAPTGRSMLPVTLGPPPGWSGTFGDRVAAAGDINRDGYGDLAVGGNRGVVVFLGDAPGVLARSARPAFGDAPCLGGATGMSLNFAGVGDTDDNGFDEVLVAAQGRCAVLFNGGPGTPTSMGVATILGAVAAEPAFAADVAGVGDVDNDGRPDFAIGVPAGMEPMPQPGVVRVWYGRPSWPAIGPPPSWMPAGTTTAFGRRLAR